VTKSSKEKEEFTIAPEIRYGIILTTGNDFTAVVSPISFFS